MDQAFQAVPITDRVHWVGAIDWAIRDFHGYATTRGTTYNAYLVVADRVTLVDTVKAPFRREMMARIASVVDPSQIDTVISNHSEMDHSGCLPETIAAVRPARVLASANGVKALAAHFGDLGCPVEAVADGQSVSLGGLDAMFVETRMLHWPDSMFCYLAGENVLFSQDGFGMHLASCERFADEIPGPVLRQEAAKYFANILLPFAPFVLKTLTRYRDLGLTVDIIAPDHGPVYRMDLDWILSLYAAWAAQEPTRKAVVVYDTMWESDAVMARAVAEGLSAGGAGPVRVLPMRAAHRSDVATEILDAGALVAGSPTLNRTLFPTMADVFSYLEGLRPQNLVGAAFGSYGWSGEGVDRVADALKAIGVDIVAGPVKVRYRPTAEDLGNCRAMGREVAEALVGRVGSG